MKTGDGGNQAEPEAVSWRVAAMLEPVKALEHMLVFAGGMSRPATGGLLIVDAANGTVLSQAARETDVVDRNEPPGPSHALAGRASLMRVRGSAGKPREPYQRRWGNGAGTAPMN